MNIIIEEFTVSRINQYMYGSEDPKDNITLLAYLIRQHGYNYPMFIQKLKEAEPEIYKRLFVKAS